MSGERAPDRSSSEAAAVEGDKASERASSAPPSAAPSSKRVLPRLMLAPLVPAELIYERLHEPSTDSPILYRERAYLVDAQQTDDDLEEQLEAELSRIRRDWRHRDASQFVQLSLFDQRFHGEPSLPPIATLSWKDWQGKTEIWVRGVRRSTLPPGIPLSVLPGMSSSASRSDVPREDASWLVPDAVLEPGENDDADELELVELGIEDAEPNTLPFGAPASQTRSPVPDADDELRAALQAARGSADASAEGERAPDSGPAYQSPDRSGEYLIPLTDDAVAAPSSQRVPAGDELMDALFERMHELSSVLTIAAATDFVLGMLADHIACDGVAISGFDPARNELVIMRASGARGRELIGRRSPLDVPPRGEALRQGESLELSAIELARSPGPWRALDVVPACAILAPISGQGRLLGAIELCRGVERGPFSPGQSAALELVCQQLAELIGDRALELDRASLLPEP